MLQRCVSIHSQLIESRTFCFSAQISHRNACKMDGGKENTRGVLSGECCLCCAQQLLTARMNSTPPRKQRGLVFSFVHLKGNPGWRLA
jgi:hypothetical protein